MKYEFAAMGFDFDWLHRDKQKNKHCAKLYSGGIKQKKTIKKAKTKKLVFNLNEFIIQEKLDGYLE